MIIETHAHIYKPYFSEELNDVIKRAQKAGVEKFVLPNVSAASILNVLECCDEHPGVCFPMAGLHPCDVKENYREELAAISAWFERRKFVAVGEIGMDLYWDLSFKEQQVEALQIQLSWAEKMNLPVSIHSRNANAEVIDIIKSYGAERVRGVFHCFSGTYEQAKEVIEMGFMLGIGGVVTFKNGGLDNIIKQTGLSHVVLETDAPYLAPVPHRGKTNEPAYLPYIVQKISEILEMKHEEIKQITSSNALKLFAL